MNTENQCDEEGKKKTFFVEKMVEAEDKDERFCRWLAENGAKHPKILWPSNDTESGIRGAIALGDIETNETMMEIPVKLMMSEINAYNDPVIGECLERHRSIINGDELLALYIMYEILKGEASFYAPYINILPTPSNTTYWSQAQLQEIQDPVIELKTKNRREFLTVRSPPQ